MAAMGLPLTNINKHKNLASRHLNEQFAAELTRLSFKLLEVVALGLELTARALHPLFLPSQCTLVRLNYYPVTPSAPPDAFGVSHHKDSGFLTVPLQDKQLPGLQVATHMCAVQRSSSGQRDCRRRHGRCT